MNVPIRALTPTAKLPVYATPGAAAADLCADLAQPLVLAPGQRAAVPTGLAAEAPAGYALFLFARSGLGIKHGIALANGVGVVDSDYRGEIKVGLINTSDAAYTVQPGDRIAQMALIKVEQAIFSAADSLSATDRGAGGFGSTGK